MKNKKNKRDQIIDLLTDARDMAQEAAMQAESVASELDSLIDQMDGGEPFYVSEMPEAVYVEGAYLDLADMLGDIEKVGSVGAEDEDEGTLDSELKPEEKESRAAWIDWACNQGLRAVEATAIQYQDEWISRRCLGNAAILGFGERADGLRKVAASLFSTSNLINVNSTPLEYAGDKAYMGHLQADYIPTQERVTISRIVRNHIVVGTWAIAPDDPMAKTWESIYRMVGLLVPELGTPGVSSWDDMGTGRSKA
jgi:hypothetical protein